MTRVLTLTLALLIAVTSQQMAIARGVAMDAHGQIILCTGQGPVAVVVDRDGQPIDGTGGIVHICPDCALTLLAAMETPDARPIPVVHMQTLTQTAVTALQKRVIPTPTHARGPPLFA